jgi:phenylacetate-CoA ligase
MNIRKNVFWLLDYLKGNQIRKHYDEIKFILDNPNSNKSKAISDLRLNELINHAISTSTFYKNKGYKTIRDFPVINKLQVLDNFDQFQSTKFINKSLRKVATSGSTGIPFRIYQDKDKTNRNTADAIYFSSQANYIIGQKLIYIKLWDQRGYKSKTQLFFQNIIPFNILKNSNYEIEELLEKIKNIEGKKAIIIYPSFLERVCKYLDVYYDDSNYNITSIITMSETLNQYERVSASKYFDSPVYERYSNIENGILAQQTSDSGSSYKINTASYHVEILKTDSDEPAEDGEVGRIVITDLFNYAVPLIRYDTGDMACLEKGNSTTLLKVYGRKMDMIYDTKGRIVFPHIFYKIYDFSDLKQFQFIQNGEKEYCFKLNSTKEKTDEEGLISHYKKYLGNDAQFNFEYVDEIPLLISGKRKKVVNNYIK